MLKDTRKRYYGGCKFVDVAESLAIERAKRLFKADHANVQPHSGTQANMAVYFACLELGDTVLEWIYHVEASITWISC